MVDTKPELPPIVLQGVRPMADELYDQLRSAIVNGELAPNERVVEEAIAARAGVSRTPVREALNRLEVDGLIRTSPHGTTVIEFSADELSDTCAVRDVLEALAARNAAARRTDMDLAMLEELTADYERAIGGDVARVIDLNHDFHDVIWASARNSYLSRQLGVVRALIERRASTTLSDEERQLETLVEHREILQALATSDADAAEAATLKHFHRASARRILARRTSARNERRT